jgi:hypothetical protein
MKWNGMMSYQGQSLGVWTYGRMDVWTPGTHIFCIFFAYFLHGWCTNGMVDEWHTGKCVVEI